MRQNVIDYIKGLNLGTYRISEEIPRNESGTPIYLKNVKTIYVEANEYSDEPLINTLGGLSIHTYTQTVSLVFSSDSKQLPANYDSLVGQLINAKDVNSATEFYNQREATVTTAVENNDILVTQIEYAYTKIR
jgi:hypothetical protein